jgi:hypothetical protein
MEPSSNTRRTSTKKGSKSPLSLLFLLALLVAAMLMAGPGGAMAQTASDGVTFITKWGTYEEY